MDYQALIKIAVLALMVSPICLTITRTKVFEPFRNFIKSKNKWLGKLFSCPYCFSHWTCFIVIAVFKPVVISSGYFFLIDYAVSAFIMICITTLISGFLYQAIISMD